MILHHIICQVPIVIHQNIHWQYSYSHELGFTYHFSHITTTTTLVNTAA